MSSTSPSACSCLARFANGACAAARPTCDVVVIGGGPAGSATAALLAEQGHQVLVLEREKLPRFHIGESLIPETYWSLKRLGLLDELKKSAYPRKYSVQFVTESGKESTPFYFDEHNPHECSMTWQVVRSELDKILLDNAQRKGAIVKTDAQVIDMIWEGEGDDRRAAGVIVKCDTGAYTSTHEIRAKVVVDATGQTAFIANRLGLKRSDPRLKKATVWNYFKGAHRDPGKDEGATLIIQSKEKKSWFWYIPLPDDIVSVGVTGDLSYIFSKGRGTAEEIFWQEAERAPGVKWRIEKGEAISEYRTTKDFSYQTTQAAGNGWVLVGDAFGFIDPVYSSGVFLALKSGEFAADAIHEALSLNDLSATRLGSWQAKHRSGIDLFRKLVYAFYSPEFSIGSFMKEHMELKNHLVDILIGNVYKPGIEELFQKMGPIQPPLVEEREKSLAMAGV
jgi:flavin-dependent dehydrogenase